MCGEKFPLTSMGGWAGVSPEQTRERGPPSVWAEIYLHPRAGCTQTVHGLLLGVYRLYTAENWLYLKETKSWVRKLNSEHQGSEYEKMKFSHTCWPLCLPFNDLWYMHGIMWMEFYALYFINSIFFSLSPCIFVYFCIFVTFHVWKHVWKITKSRSELRHSQSFLLVLTLGQAEQYYIYLHLVSYCKFYHYQLGIISRLCCFVVVFFTVHNAAHRFLLGIHFLL